MGIIRLPIEFAARFFLLIVVNGEKKENLTNTSDDEDRKEKRKEMKKNTKKMIEKQPVRHYQTCNMSYLYVFYLIHSYIKR